MLSIKLLALVPLFALGTVYSSPLTPRATCNPNFEGAGLSVISQGKEWGASSFQAGADITGFSYRGPMYGNADFRFEQTGGPVPSYLVKDIRNNELVVGLSSNKLQLQNINYSGDPNQIWLVACDYCGTDVSRTHGLVANGCMISSVTNGKCVQTSGLFDTLTVADCTGGDSQRFEFWTTI